MRTFVIGVFAHGGIVIFTQNDTEYVLDHCEASAVF